MLQPSYFARAPALPSLGDRLALADVSGSVSTLDVQMQYSGIEPGFNYAIKIDAEGQLEMEALSDGVPFAPDTVFRQGFEGQYTSN